MMRKMHANLVLIGMPGSGKSTVGVILAKKMGRDFVDTDLLIQLSEDRTLQDIVDTDGYAALRDIEEQVLLDLDVSDHVVATGGSAVYCERAVNHLRENGILIFLDTGLDELQSRIQDFGTRGLAKRPDQSFSELFEERFPLYTKYADISIPCDNMTQEQVCDGILSEVAGMSSPQPT